MRRFGHARGVVVGLVSFLAILALGWRCMLSTYSISGICLLLSFFTSNCLADLQTGQGLVIDKTRQGTHNNLRDSSHLKSG